MVELILKNARVTTGGRRILFVFVVAFGLYPSDEPMFQVWLKMFNLVGWRTDVKYPENGCIATTRVGRHLEWAWKFLQIVRGFRLAPFITGARSFQRTLVAKTWIKRWALSLLVFIHWDQWQDLFGLQRLSDFHQEWILSGISPLPRSYSKVYLAWIFEMLSINSSCRYFLYRKPTDMRFGIYSLSGLVRNELGVDPLNGDVYIFIGKRRNQVRLLQWDRDGFAMYIKRLERGTFEEPQGQQSLITSRQLTLLMEGVMLTSVRLRKRYTPLKTAWN